jgi:hypothetical protein
LGGARPATSPEGRSLPWRRLLQPKDVQQAQGV